MDLTKDYSRLDIDLTLGQHYLNWPKAATYDECWIKRDAFFLSLGKGLLSLRPLSSFSGVHRTIRLYIFSRVKNWKSRRYVSFYTLLLLSAIPELSCLTA